MPIGFIRETVPESPIQTAVKLIESDFTLNELQELTDHLAAYICRKRRDDAEINQAGGETLCQK